MNKKIMTIMSIVMCVVLITMPTFCESAVIYTQGAKDNAAARAEGKNKSAVIQSTRKKGEKAQIDMDAFNSTNAIMNMADYPAPMGKDRTRVTYCPEKIPFTMVIESPYRFITDDYGNIGIAYMDERLNIPVNAMGGFYVVQKQNPATKQVEWVKYCVDFSGYILFGWIVEGDGTKYYLSEEDATLGQVVKGAVTFANGKKYYFDEDGILQNYEE